MKIEKYLTEMPAYKERDWPKEEQELHDFEKFDRRRLGELIGFLKKNIENIEKAYKKGKLSPIKKELIDMRDNTIYEMLEEFL